MPCRYIAHLRKGLLSEKALAEKLARADSHFGFGYMVFVVVAHRLRAEEHIYPRPLLIGQYEVVRKHDAAAAHHGSSDYVDPFYPCDKDDDKQDNEQHERRAVVRLQNYQHERQRGYRNRRRNILKLEQPAVPVHRGGYDLGKRNDERYLAQLARLNCAFDSIKYEPALRSAANLAENKQQRKQADYAGIDIDGQRFEYRIIEHYHDQHGGKAYQEIGYMLGQVFHVEPAHIIRQACFRAVKGHSHDGGECDRAERHKPQHYRNRHPVYMFEVFFVE